MQWVWNSLITCLLLWATGCARLTPPVPVDTRPNAAKAYFYSNLGLEDRSGFMVGNAEIALQLKHLDSGRHLNLRFLKEQHVQAVEVKPGSYQLTGVVFMDGFNAVFAERPLVSNGQSWVFEARPGRAYYVGDARGWVGWVKWPRKQYRWQVTKFENRFRASTQHFRQRYPGLAVLPVENALVNEQWPNQTPMLLANQ